MVRVDDFKSAGGFSTGTLDLLLLLVHTQTMIIPIITNKIIDSAPTPTHAAIMMMVVILFTPSKLRERERERILEMNCTTIITAENFCGVQFSWIFKVFAA